MQISGNLSKLWPTRQAETTNILLPFRSSFCLKAAIVTGSSLAEPGGGQRKLLLLLLLLVRVLSLKSVKCTQVRSNISSQLWKWL